jgi:predicted enzyme related to lactoylglutathione lyase
MPVRDLEEGLRFYRDGLGHTLIWRKETSAGLRLAEDDAELVIHVEGTPFEVDLKVESADAAAAAFVAAGGRIVRGPFDIQIGRCAVVADPWGNVLVLLDTSKGRLVTDAEGNVVGNGPAYDRRHPSAARTVNRR